MLAKQRSGLGLPNGQPRGSHQSLRLRRRPEWHRRRVYGRVYDHHRGPVGVANGPRVLAAVQRANDERGANRGDLRRTKPGPRSPGDLGSHARLERQPLGRSVAAAHPGRVR
eukprot:scaffold1087_cov198-Pinguiococcus_pyrenoidosus.AAC.1